MEINYQRIIRTGDKIVSKIDNTKVVVHYIVNKNLNQSFEEQLLDVNKVIVYDGIAIKELRLEDIIFN